MTFTVRPIEVTTRYATSVPTLADAWAFVMAKIDSVGPSPRVEISPVWTIVDDDEGTQGQFFSVVVSGMVEES